MDGLPPKRARFVREYLVDLNATRAAIRAGYSPKSAGQQASELLKDPKVSASVAAGQERLSRKVEITAEKVLEDIDRIATKAEEADEYQAALKGRELLGKRLGLFTDKVEHSGGVTIVVKTDAPPTGFDS